MAVDRRRLRRDGPPSQKLAIAAIWAGSAGIGTGLIATIAGGDVTVRRVALVLAFVLYMTAFAVERRERRREAAKPAGGGGDGEVPARIGSGVLWVIAGLFALMAVALAVAALEDHAGPGAGIAAAAVAALAALIVRAARRA